MQNSIILCTNKFKGSCTADDSVFDVHTIGRHTSANNNVYINLKAVETTTQSGNQFIQTDEGPLRLFTFFDLAGLGVELMPVHGGCRVTSVREGTLFAKAGFQKGDIIFSVDNGSGASVDAIRRRLRRPAAGADCVFRVLREDMVVELSVKLAE